MNPNTKRKVMEKILGHYGLLFGGIFLGVYGSFISPGLFLI